MIHPDRVANEDLRAVSNGLRDLRDWAARLVLDGRGVPAAEIAALAQVLDLLAGLARQIENEVSASRWNAAAAQDRQDDITEAVLRASEAPDGTVVLFPVAGRPFTDGGRP